ncbi:MULTISPECIES: TfoX/Sxy family protein [unclassified Micromonospora]|uniref:TfoX/Sxy family protein n=1 Tax=unclassified Micromonospora TaxID=2617518 RepID=UPI0033ADEFD4
MAFDDQLAVRVREALADQSGVTEKRMFGGLAWLVHGHMAVVALNGGGLMVRIARADHEMMLAEPGTATMVMRSRPLRGWITVAEQACATRSDLVTWVRRGLTYALTLPGR